MQGRYRAASGQQAQICEPEGRSGVWHQASGLVGWHSIAEVSGAVSGWAQRAAQEVSLTAVTTRHDICFCDAATRAGASAAEAAPTVSIRTARKGRKVAE